MNQVERWFAEITRRRIRRGTFRSTQALEAAIREYLQVYNEDPQPFIWTKSADDILKSLKFYCEGFSGEVHWGGFWMLPKEEVLAELIPPYSICLAQEYGN